MNPADSEGDISNTTVEAEEEEREGKMMTRQMSVTMMIMMMMMIMGVSAARMETRGMRRMRGGGGDVMPRPPHDDLATFARWLVHKNVWGVMATRNADSGLPWANVVDLSDGAKCESTGRLLFYLTSLDETAHDAEKFSTVSFTVAEAALGCGQTDPEDPTCAKLTVMGKLLPVPASEADEVTKMIASRHPVITHWPPNHGFKPYELKIDSLHLLDYYGGMKDVDVKEYFDVKLDCIPPTRNAHRIKG